MQSFFILLIQTDIGTGVLHSLRADIRTGSIGRGIHMGDQANGGEPGITGDSAIDIAILIHEGIADAHGLHLLHDGCAQELLLGGGGAGGGIFIRLGIKADIAEEPLSNSFH